MKKNLIWPLLFVLILVASPAQVVNATDGGTTGETNTSILFTEALPDPDDKEDPDENKDPDGNKDPEDKVDPEVPETDDQNKRPGEPPTGLDQEKNPIQNNTTVRGLANLPQTNEKPDDFVMYLGWLFIVAGFLVLDLRRRERTNES